MRRRLIALSSLIFLSGCNYAAFSWEAAASGVGVASVAAAIVATTLQVRLSREQAKRDDARAYATRLAALLDSTGDAACGWSSGALVFASPRLAGLLGVAGVKTVDDVAKALRFGDAAALVSAFGRLRHDGLPFALDARSADGERILAFRGGAVTLDDAQIEALWIADVTVERLESERQAAMQSAMARELTELRAALDALPAPVWVRDGRLDLIWCNRAYAEAVDAPRDEVVERKVEIFRDAFGVHGAALARQAKDELTTRSARGHTVIGGGRRLMEFVEAPAPHLDLSVGYALDLTREEELQGEIARHVAAHGEVLERLATAIAVYGPDTRLKFFNSAFAQLWRLDERWLETEPTLSEVLEDLRTRRMLPEQSDFAYYKKRLLRSFNSLIEPQEELQHRPDGSTLRVVTTPHPFGGIMMAMEDVTGELALESSYNTLMAVQRETLDHLAEGLAVFGGDGRLRLSNPSFARIWGLDPAMLEGQPHVAEVVDRFAACFDPEENDWDAIREALLAGAFERTSRAARFRLKARRFVDFAAAPLPDGGALYTFIDVSDSVRVEEALRRSNAALETADRLKSEFIANVSYQLRTPLNAIMGFAEILTNQYFGPLNERQMEYGGNILDASSRLLALIDDILDLASIEAGTLTLEASEIDVAALVGDVVALSRDWAAKRRLTLEASCDDDVGSIRGDQRRLKQAVFNLVSNAIKFTPEGGRIRLSVRRDGDELHVTVADTGVGIPETEREHIFDRFARGHSGRTGAGLGLSLVKSFIELHGGHVAVASVPEGGTAIDCILPASAAPSAAMDAPTPRVAS